LLSVGEEETKGNELTRETHQLLKASALAFVGNVEARGIFSGEADVVVCDGFTGNILLKTWESLAKFITTMLKGELKANALRTAGALLAKGAFDALKGRMNPDRYGGAPLLGVRGNILKAHGSSNRHALASAIRAAAKIIHQDLYQHTIQDVAQANEALAAPAPVNSPAPTSAS
jgi:glycerol-3-phosphate acyltransferase PlsX